MIEYEVTITRVENVPGCTTVGPRIFSRVIPAHPDYAALGKVLDAVKAPRVRKPKVAKP